MGCSVERHVVCMMSRPRMVGGDDVGAGVVSCGNESENRGQPGRDEDPALGPKTAGSRI
jgi:hypothetical protein